MVGTVRGSERSKPKIGGEHEEQRRWSESDHEDQGSGTSHAMDNEEATETSSLPAAITTEEKKRACHDHDRFDFSDVLLAHLSEIRASTPSFVDMKRLQSSDVRDDQNRLQLSVRSPISQIFTDAEKVRVRTSGGMPVTAFDHRGQQYEITCKLWRDKHYRFMGPGWKNFRQAHHLTIAKEARLTRRVAVKLLAFRSRALQPEVKDDDGEEEPGTRMARSGWCCCLLTRASRKKCLLRRRRRRRSGGKNVSGADGCSGAFATVDKGLNEAQTRTTTLILKRHASGYRVRLLLATSSCSGNFR